MPVPALPVVEHFDVVEHISNASSASSLARLAFIDQPITAREYRSSTTARYSQPSAVRRYVMSVTHAWSGCSTVNWRCRRFGANDRRLAAVATFARRAHRTQAAFAHQSLDTLAAETLAGFGEARCTLRTVDTTALQIRFLDHHEQALILTRARRLRLLQPRIEPLLSTLSTRHIVASRNSAR
jgi:hypothetical protein